MDRKVFHGNIIPADIAQALIGEFNHGNLRAQTIGRSDKMIVQVSTRPGAMSGGQTALTITVEKVEDGIMVELGQQAWLGVAASLGMSALSAIRNPFNLLGRLDDIAQDIENLQISEKIWQVINQTMSSAGASTELSGRLKRLACDYCGVANQVGGASCIACGAPLGNIQPITCGNCGFVVNSDDKICPNCGEKLSSGSSHP
jgi:hypothetical protein